MTGPRTGGVAHTRTLCRLTFPALRGRVDRRSTATLVAKLAAIVPGVVEVIDQLLWEYDDDVEAVAGYYRSHPFTANA